MNIYSWVLHEKYQKEILRQGVVSANSEKEAKMYLIASFNLDEHSLYYDDKNILVFKKIS